MIWVVHLGSRIRMLTLLPSRIPDPGVKKAPNPGSRIRNTAAMFRILVRTDFALVDPDLYRYWERVSGSRSKEIDQS